LEQVLAPQNETDLIMIKFETYTPFRSIFSMVSPSNAKAKRGDVDGKAKILV